MQPSPKARAIRCVGVATPRHTSQASSSACTIDRAWVSISRRRRSKRSISTPPKGLRTRMGIWLAKPTTPSTSAEPVSR